MSNWQPWRLQGSCLQNITNLDIFFKMTEKIEKMSLKYKKVKGQTREELLNMDKNVNM